MADQSIPDLIQQIATEMGQKAGMDANALNAFVYAALGSAYQESGFNPRAVGDNGTSFGLFQLHEGGELGSMSPDQAYDPATNIRTALSEFVQVWQSNRGVAQNPGEWAALSQRPADEAGYANLVNAHVTAFSKGQVPIGPSVSGATAPVGQAPAPSGPSFRPSPWGSYSDYAGGGFSTPPASTLGLPQTGQDNAQQQQFTGSQQVIPDTQHQTDSEFQQHAQAWWDEQPHPQAPSVKVKDMPTAIQLATALKQGGHAEPSEAEGFWNEYQPLLQSGLAPDQFMQALEVMAPLAWAFHGRPPSLSEFKQLWDEKNQVLKPVSQITDYFKSLPDKHYPHVTAGDMVKALQSATPFARQFLGREPVKSEAAFLHHSGANPADHYKALADQSQQAKQDVKLQQQANAGASPVVHGAGEYRS